MLLECRIYEIVTQLDRHKTPHLIQKIHQNDLLSWIEIYEPIKYEHEKMLQKNHIDTTTNGEIIIDLSMTLNLIHHQIKSHEIINTTTNDTTIAHSE